MSAGVSEVFTRMRRAGDRVARRVAGRLLPTSPGVLRVGARAGGVTIDELRVEPLGVIRLSGWSRSGSEPGVDVRFAGHRLDRLSIARTYRPDLASRLRDAAEFAGFVADFRAAPDQSGHGRLVVEVGGVAVWSTTIRWRVNGAHYSHLLDTDAILGRDAIYAVGPPTSDVAADSLALARSIARTPSLDFGCGAAPLVRAMRASGIDTIGLEVERNDLVLADDIAPHVRRYDGRLPTPFDDGSFATSFCFEVLEHVDEPDRVVAELARVTKRACAVTVPDASAIPFGHRHQVVPWHLLEASHRNFFTPRSLHSLMQRHFARVELIRLGLATVNDTLISQSIAAVGHHDD